MKKYIKEWIVFAGLIMLGIFTRTVFQIAPNVEFITAITLVSAVMLRKSKSALVPFITMIVSDLIIGNGSIFIFTWSAFAGIYLLGIFGKKLFTGEEKTAKKIGYSALGGFASTIFFYLWTNLGVVIVSSMYPKSFEGILLSYKMGLPFLVPQLLGNLIITPALFMVVDLAANGKLSFVSRLKTQAE